jgi:serine/threonine-protein kinase
MPAVVLVLANGEWTLGDSIGRGGFGQVFEAHSGEQRGAAKLIPKDPGAERELLFIDLGSARNVVPILDSGETDDHWVIVMPRAETSLREWLVGHAGPVGPDLALPVLRDVATALVDLRGSVVHRDIKPENVLLLDGSWCLSDFGISRYAEATTAPDTRKFSLTPEYAAPERWRNERATSATDVYSVGVMAYEMLHGTQPFLGPHLEDFREQHLHLNPEPLEHVPPLVSALVDECLLKASGARPTPENLLTRIERANAGRPSSPGLAQLQDAHRADVARRAEADRRKAEEQTAEERRTELYEAAARSVVGITAALLDAIEHAAPSARVKATDRGHGWTAELGDAVLAYSGVTEVRSDPWKWQPPAFEVIAAASLSLRVPADRRGYQGRSHSLWYCDAQEAGHYQWFETAFMVSPLMQRAVRENPFSLAPGEKAAKALWRGMSEYQVAWPFTRLELGNLDDWIDRWAVWLSEASDGRLHSPSRMPEHDTKGTWR